MNCFHKIALVSVLTAGVSTAAIANNLPGNPIALTSSESTPVTIQIKATGHVDSFTGNQCLYAFNSTPNKAVVLGNINGKDKAAQSVKFAGNATKVSLVYYQNPNQGPCSTTVSGQSWTCSSDAETLKALGAHELNITISSNGHISEMTLGVKGSAVQCNPL